MSNAPAAEQTASPLVLPSLEDKKWASDLERRLRLTFLPKKAAVALTAETVRAIEGKNLWRLNHLLTTGFNYAIFGTAKADPDADISDAYYDSSRRSKDGETLGKYYNNDFRSVLTLAISTGDEEGAKLLVERGAVPFKAVTRGSAEVRGILVNKGKTALLLSLLDDKAAPDAAYRREVVSQIVSQAIRANQLDLLKAVEQKFPGAIAGAKEHSGAYRYDLVPTEALAIATSNGVGAPMVAYILEQRKDAVAAKIADGAFLSTAIRNRNEDAAIALLGAGAPATDLKDGYSPLAGAAKAALPAVVAALLDKGADKPYTETLGAELLKATTSARGDGFNWGEIARTAEVLVERLPISAYDIREAMKGLPADSAPYKVLKAAAFKIDPDGQDTGSTWRAFGSQQVGIVTRDNDTGLQLTEVFNFATKEHFVVSRNLETKADTILLRENFDEMKNKTALAEAQKYLPKAKAAAAAPKAA